MRCTCSKTQCKYLGAEKGAGVQRARATYTFTVPPPVFQRLEAGTQPFFIAVTNWPYAVGDMLVFQPYHPHWGTRGITLTKTILSVIRWEDQEGLHSGYCCLGLGDDVDA